MNGLNLDEIAVLLERHGITCVVRDENGNVEDNCRTLYRIGKDEVNDSAFDEI